MAYIFNPQTGRIEDPNTGKSFDAREFDYQQAKTQNDYGRKYAEGLRQRGMQAPQGQMISGHYVAPSWTQHLSTLLSAYVGGKDTEAANKSDADLSAQSRAMTAKALEDYRRSMDPSNYVDEAQKASPLPEPTYTYKNMDEVGPASPFAKPQPVRTGDASFTFGPEVKTPGAVQPQPAPVQQPAPSGPAPVLGRGQAIQRANREASRQRILATEAAVNPPAQQPAPVQAAPASAQRVPMTTTLNLDTGPAQTPPDGNPFNVQQPDAGSVKRAEQGQIRFLRKAMAADRASAIDALDRSGPRGQVFAQALAARDMAPAEFDYKTVKQGDSEVLVAVNKRDPSQVVQVTEASGTPSLAAQRLEFDRQKDAREAGVKGDAKSRGIADTLAANDYAIRQIDELLPIAGEATGVTGKFSNWFSHLTGVGTDSAVAHERLESVKGGLLATAMRMTKEQSGTAAGMSQQESAALQKSIASLDPRVGEQELAKQLNEVRRQMRLYGDRLRASLGETASQPEATTTAAPQGNYRVPARGQRVTSPDDYGF